jgi:hypothetical protein
MNMAKTSIRIEPEVPKSNVVPIMEAPMAPEKAEDTKAATANKLIGIRYLTFGISMMPVERTDERKTAKIATRPVAKSVILAAYKLTELAGTKNTGRRKTKTERIRPNFFTNTFSLF